MSRYMSGEYEHKLDAKGRVIMPSRFRAELGVNFWMTKGGDNCILVFPDEEWKAFVDTLNALPYNSRKAQQAKRHYIAGAYPCEIDGQGRTLIPQKLREHAGIAKDLTIIGIGDKLEIWSRESWLEAQKEADESMTAGPEDDIDVPIIF